MTTNKQKETVTITKDEFESLKEDSVWRACVEAAGVDNWEGFDYAMGMLKSKDLDD